MAKAGRTTLSTDAWDDVYTYLQTTNAISTNNIFSAYNSKLVSSTGYPLVIIYPPSVSFDPLSVNGNMTESIISFLIEIYELQAQTVKSQADNVCAKLLAGRATFNGQGLKRMKISGGEYDFWEEGNKTVHRLSYNVTFRYVDHS